MKAASSTEKRLNRFLTVIAWVFVFTAVGVGGWFYFFSSSHVTTNDAQVKQYITPVASQVSGFIQEVRFEENQAVHKGDTLLVIDNRDLGHKIMMAEANLATTSASVYTQEEVAKSKLSDIHIVEANLEAAKVEVWRAEQDYTRFKSLVEQDAATLQQFEQQEAVYKQAKAKLLALQQQKEAIKAVAQAEKAKVNPVRQQLSEKKASVENARLHFSFTYLTAPYDGWVGTKNVQVGQLVKEGQALVQVVSKEKWIIANFRETQLEGLEKAKDISITADAYPSITFKGKVESYSPVSGAEFALVKPNNATGNFVKIEQRFPVKIVLDESTELGKLRSGMNVYVVANQ